MLRRASSLREQPQRVAEGAFLKENLVIEQRCCDVSSFRRLCERRRRRRAAQQQPQLRQPLLQGEQQQQGGLVVAQELQEEEKQEFPRNVIVSSKYTVINFIPKSLLEQFKRLANLYFLVLSILMTVGTYFPSTFDSPLTPWSTLGPLCVVLVFTMIKEAVEDIKRHHHDGEVGLRPAWVLTSAQQQQNAFVQSTWERIEVGNIVRLKSGDPVPADMVILASSENGGLCFVETSNIDGETNLKQKRAVKSGDDAAPFSGETPNLQAMISSSLLRVVCEAPNGNIHAWEGFLEYTEDKQRVSADDSNFLLRGSSVQNVSWVHGLVVYTGSDTKLAKNASKPRLKISNVEKITNYLIRVIFGLMFVICTVSTIALLLFRKYHKDIPYLQKSGDSFDLPFSVAYWLTFLILYCNLLPMSLYITVEMVNYAQAYFIDSDLEMYDPACDTPARAVTSNLNSDLGQIEYIFSDKTGTLTQNVMVFRRCFVGGKIYGKKMLSNLPPGLEDGAVAGEEFELDQIQADLLPQASGAKADSYESFSSSPMGKVELDAFFTCLAVAHTVVIELENGKQEYRAESPDEKALCEGARDVGFEFTERIGESNTVVIHKAHEGGKEERFQILAINEFTSARKRMSALVKNDKGEYFLFAKGADNVMLERKKCFGLSPASSAPASASSSADSSQDQLVREKKFEASLREFANDGLRTLVLGMRQIDGKEAEDWIANQFKKAQSAVGNRDEELGKAADLLEKDLLILGVTAIEDKLQEGVCETLEDLRAAGIKIWVLTGDKLETAVNIGYSSRLLDESMRLIEIQAETKESIETLLGHLTRRRAPETASGASTVDVEAVSASRNPPESEAQLAMAVTGKALNVITKSPELVKAFLEVALTCRVVVACRVSPAQKAEVVRLVKKNAHSEAFGSASAAPITLAIGDGANDVSMIQEAQVGVGVSGKEGMQAVNASDFAIAQFRFLRRLLLVHGRWSYRRMAKVVLYSLYKNFVLVLTLFAFQAFCAYSGISLYESMVQAGYNFFLGLPPVALGMFDREISAQFALKNPQLYISGRKNLNLTPLKLGWRIFEALVHSTVIFGLPVVLAAQYSLNVELSSHRFDGSPGIYVLGTIHYTCLIVVMQFKMLLDTATVTLPSLGVWLFSFLFYFSWLILYSSVYFVSPDYYGVAIHTLSMPVLWLVIILCTATCVVFDVSIKLTRLLFIPHPVDILIERDRAALAALSEYKKILKKQQEKRGADPTSAEDEQALAEHFQFVIENAINLGEFSSAGQDAINQLRENQDRPKDWRTWLSTRIEDMLLYVNDAQDHYIRTRKISLTPSELNAMGIQPQALRSSYDFSHAQRLER